MVAPASFGLEVLNSWHSLMPQPWRFLVAGDGSKPGPRQPAGDYTQIEAQSEDVHMKNPMDPLQNAQLGTMCKKGIVWY